MNTSVDTCRSFVRICSQKDDKVSMLLKRNRSVQQKILISYFSLEISLEVSRTFYKDVLADVVYNCIFDLLAKMNTVFPRYPSKTKTEDNKRLLFLPLMSFLPSKTTKSAENTVKYLLITNFVLNA